MLIHINLGPEEKRKLNFLQAYLRKVTPQGVPVAKTAVMRWALDVAFMAMLQSENPEEWQRRVDQTKGDMDALVPCDSSVQPAINREEGPIDVQGTGET